MSTWNEQSKTIAVSIRADNEATEIFVIDGQFALVKSGLGYLEAQLPPGLYKLKYKAGPAIVEEKLAVKPGSPPLEIQGPVLDLSAAVPIANTRSSRPEHERVAQAMSHTSRLNLGRGSSLFVFIRDLETTEPDNVATGLSLHHPDGRLLLDYAEYASTNPADHWAGCNINAAPGTYFLRLQTQTAKPLFLSVAVCKGWQTQVFLTRRNYGSQRAADLLNASILLARPDEGFWSDRPQLRYTELARQGLANSRQVVSDSDLHDLLWAKYENPMLGIYGAHLLLQEKSIEKEKSINWDLLKTVVKNLRRLVGDHPDVLALLFPLAAAGQRLGQLPNQMESPPMLRNSWRLLLAASVTHPELIPPNSLNGRIADRVWGEGAWLVWQQPEDVAPGLVKVARSSRRAPRDLLTGLAGDLIDRNIFETILAQGNLTDVEEDLLRYAYRARQMQQALAASAAWIEAAEPPQLPDETDLTRAFGLPYPVLQQLLGNLDDKVQELANRGVVTRGSVQLGGDRAVLGSETGGNIITGSGNRITRHTRGGREYVNVGGVELPVRKRRETSRNLQAELAELDQTIASVRKLLSGAALQTTLEPLLQKRAELEAELQAGAAPTGGVTTEDSFQQVGQGGVAGSSAKGDIVTGDDNVIEDWSDDDVADTD
ncbi:MAG: hypothetical protein FOGNACKC_01981 [Anaerolineae bacterium]|nr:hypothetical protein [Anaerolineae bacterium]